MTTVRVTFMAEMQDDGSAVVAPGVLLTPAHLAGAHLVELAPEFSCSVPGCIRPVHVRGICNAHYLEGRKSGAVQPLPAKSWQERYWEKVNKTETCWLWTGAVADHGYGTHLVDGRTRLAHRLAVQLSGRVIPPKMQVDHLCRVRRCVNPEHLEIVTPRVNTERGMAPTMITHVTGICKRGHSMEDAIIVRRKDGRVSQRCRPCQQASNARSEARRKAELNGGAAP